MSRIDVLRPFIEKNLAAMLESERVAPDADGEYSFPRGSAEITLRLGLLTRWRTRDALEVLLQIFGATHDPPPC